MKKFFGFIVLAVLVILPMKVSAAQYGISWTGSKPDAEGYFTVTVKGTQTGENKMEAFSSTMTLTNVEFIEAQGIGTWRVIRDGLNLQFSTTVPIEDASFDVATIKFKKVNTAEECNVLFTCDNGESKTVTPEKAVTNPKTGSALPYAVIAIGVVMAAGVYYVTRRNEKLYKI